MVIDLLLQGAGAGSAVTRGVWRYIRDFLIKGRKVGLDSLSIQSNGSEYNYLLLFVVLNANYHSKKNKINNQKNKKMKLH
jgi:hypothetical protein